MNRPTDLIEKLKVSSKAANGRWYKGTFVDSVPDADPENTQTLLRWLEVLEELVKEYRQSHIYGRRPCINSAECSTCKAARELEARDELRK